MRKIIQLESCEVKGYVIILYALCSDGTVWQQYGSNDWKELKTSEINNKTLTN